jgi:hypothetical protein
MTAERDDHQPLQFETAVPSGTPSETGTAASGVPCVLCARTITDEYYDVNGVSVCSTCRDSITQQAETPRGMAAFGKAALFGLIATILGAVLYFAVIEITRFEIGIVAIAIGYMVGYAIRMATGGRGGRRFQVLALVLTYWSVGLAYTPFVFRQAANQAQEQQQSSATPPAAQREDTGESSSPNIAVALALLLALSLALPVLSVIGSMPSGLISAAIIVFGILQAWRMTGVPQFTMSGPYRVAPSVPQA